MTEKVVQTRGEGFIKQDIREGNPIGGHPLQGFWLSHRLLQRGEVRPFMSIMHMTDSNAAKAHMAATGKKFDGDYVAERDAIESWLKTEGRLKGLDTDDEHPIYFRLYRQPVQIPKPGWTFINVPAEHVPPKLMTFTLDDSFHNYATLTGRMESTTPSGIQPNVLNADEVRQLIDTDGFPEVFDGQNPTRYIECQVWSRNIPLLRQVESFLETQISANPEGKIVTFA